MFETSANTKCNKHCKINQLVLKLVLLILFFTVEPEA